MIEKLTGTDELASAFSFIETLTGVNADSYRKIRICGRAARRLLHLYGASNGVGRRRKSRQDSVAQPFQLLPARRVHGVGQEFMMASEELVRRFIPNRLEMLS